MSNKIRGNQVRSINAIQQDEHEDLADAKRVTLVDALGEFIDSGNRLPVDAIINVSSSDATEPEIFNILVPLKDVETAQALSTNTRKFLIRVRTADSMLKLAFETGESATKFITVRYGSYYCEFGLNLVNKTLYFQTTKDSKIVEILAWT